MKQLINDGLYPVTLTPFNNDHSIDWDGMSHLIDFYLDSGADGLFINCASSEIQYLSSQDMLEIASFAAKKVNERKPVLSGAIMHDKIESQAEFIKKILDIGVDVAVIAVNQLADESEEDSVWKSRAEKLMELTGDFALGIYECPLPYHRLLDIELYEWVAKTGRFVFHKDTSCDTNKIKEKIRMSNGSNLKFFNAHIDTLLDSLNYGGNGYSGIMSNFYPDLCAALCKRHGEGAEFSMNLQNLLSNTEENILKISNVYPAVAKCFLKLKGVPLNHICKYRPTELTDQQLEQLQILSREVESVGKSYLV
ncbi:MAG: dihydrodipicolinate synthase family protein [Sedimentisphaeraceae bacterium JB056]